MYNSPWFINLFLFFLTKSFNIVKFHLPGKDNQFDVAPLKWIQKTGNRTTIYWPSDEDASTSKVLLNLISKETIVDKESWMLYNISVIAKFGKVAIWI